MKTTITLSIAFMMCFFSQRSQTPAQCQASTNYNLEGEEFHIHGKLSPVYFNFHKRQLRDLNKNIISPLDFLNLCRSINDTAIQIQVARYDAYTKNKQGLGLIALGGGFSAIGLIGSAAVSSEQGNDMMTGTCAFLGAISILAIPAVAIYSSVPHQKRKAVLFRDLPIAYNQYVETHQ